IVIAIWTPVARVRRSAIALAVLMIALIVIFHANYVPYVAIVGLGYVAWWLVTGPFGDGMWRRTLVVGGAAALACAVFMGALLPLLAQLSNFGNAPDEARITYHLTQTFGMEHITGGHIFDLLGWTGLPLICVMPWVVAKWRSARFAIVPGGILAMATVCFVPPLYHLLAATGSLTVGLRINHIFGVLLMPVFAGAMLMFGDLCTERLTTRRRRLLVTALVLLCFIAVGAVAGYRKFLPDQPGYAAWLALVIIWVYRLVRRARGRALPSAPRSEVEVTTARSGSWGARRGIAATPRTVAWVVAVITLGLAVPIGLESLTTGLRSGHQPIDAGRATGALTCLGGRVAAAIERLPKGAVVLSDPSASFQVMALAPVYVVGDYKVWNAPTKNNRVVERLASVNRFFDTSASTAERLAVLRQRNVSYLLIDIDDVRWLDHYASGTPTTSDRALSRARRVFDSFADLQQYNGGGIAPLIAANPAVFHKVVVDPRGRKSTIPPRDRDSPEVPCNSFGLWKVNRGAIDRAIASDNVKHVTKTVHPSGVDAPDSNNNVRPKRGKISSGGLVAPGSLPNSDVPTGAQS
ncbi:MAG: hypothetical protein JWN41_1689, partial [Thermoleophilia bacterium]|nr:hypothetical protein [Thermoleophilia bacterium]